MTNRCYRVAASGGELDALSFLLESADVPLLEDTFFGAGAAGWVSFALADVEDGATSGGVGVKTTGRTGRVSAILSGSGLDLPA